MYDYLYMKIPFPVQLIIAQYYNLVLRINPAAPTLFSKQADRRFDLSITPFPVTKVSQKKVPTMKTHALFDSQESIKNAHSAFTAPYSGTAFRRD